MPPSTPLVRYILRFPAPHTHYLEVQAFIPMQGKSQAELFLPVWTPGSYLIREYSRHVEGLRASDSGGRDLHLHKSRKNRWRIEGANPLHEVVISYKLYCHELSVRTSYVTDTFALIVGAATFLSEVSLLDAAYHVTLELPSGWANSCSGMRKATLRRCISAG